MTRPRATYRVQLNAEFTLHDAARMVPYLHNLGISHLYASPILSATPGSTHGYDVTDPTTVNPEIGGREALDRLVAALHRHGMGLIMDIVPNHMAANAHNPWWLDVLEHGQASEHAPTFDVRWTAAGAVEVPILGDLYGHCLENGELELRLDEDGFFLAYYDNRLPIDPGTFSLILAQAFPEDIPRDPAVAALIQTSLSLPPRSSEGSKARVEGSAAIKREMRRLYEWSDDVRRRVDGAVRALNGVNGSARSFDRLDDLLSAQAYRLTHWRLAAERVSYRRFFDITGLIGVRVNDPQVFWKTHALILELVREGLVDGLRIDHIDGLYDPKSYLQALRQSLAEAGRPDAYVVVEKILGPDEPLPPDWPVDGTTGYESIERLSRAFISPQGLTELGRAYAGFLGEDVHFQDAAYAGKRFVIDALFGGELQALGDRMLPLARLDRHARDLSPSTLVQALAEVSACLPVYRTYADDHGIADAERALIHGAVHEARARNPAPGDVAYDFIRGLMCLEAPRGLDAAERAARLSLVRRWQQFTSPVAAKGVEDTAFYRYNRLLSLNEVGGHPADGTPETVESFHRRNAEDLAAGRAGLNTGSTHDTKRSEDVRARIHVLTELQSEFADRVERWRQANARLRSRIGDREAPSRNEEWYIYQSLIGAWPLHESEMEQFRERLQSHMEKALREAKVNSDWLDPVPAYEEAIAAFVAGVTEPGDFLDDFQPFQQTVAWFGWLQSLSMLVLRLASPGAPDIYRGTGLWDLSLTDPDNRRPVDFRAREEELRGLMSRADDPRLVPELLQNWRDGRIRLFVTRQALQLRAAYADLFAGGEYLPLAARGPGAAHILGFARRLEDQWVIAAAPRLLVSLAPEGQLPVGASIWGDTALVLPPGAPSCWTNAFTGAQVTAAGLLPAKEIFADFPTALLTGRP